MTLRPFKIVSIKNIRGMFCNIETHRGEILAKNIKLSKYGIEKLMFYPITAFGYDLTDFKLISKGVEKNPKFDRHDVIKALDFWIEHWVYQNKKDYILEGTVNKDFELTVRELIEFREAVLKMPANTEFVRQKIRVQEDKDGDRFNFQQSGKYYHFKNNKVETNMTEKQVISAGQLIGKIFPKPKPLFQPAVDQIIEFTENVLDSSNTSASTVDQFCYVVRKMTHKEYLEHNKPKLYNKDLTQGITGSNRLSGIISGIIEAQARFNFEENFRDEGSRFNFEGGRHTDTIRNFTMMRPNDMNTDQWVIIPNMIGTILGGFMIRHTQDGSTIASGFTTEDQAREFMQQVRDRLDGGTVPPTVGMNFPASMPDTSVLEFDALLPSQRRGPDHLLHSNLHPGIDFTVSDVRFVPSDPEPDSEFQIVSVPATAQSVTIQDDDEEDEEEWDPERDGTPMH